MVYGGVLVAVAVIVTLATLPYLVARRSAMMQSRENDRFSPSLRLVESASVVPVDECADESPALLNGTRPVQRRSSPVAHNAPVLTAEAARARSRGVREISALRARRAARLSAEAAAARRRVLLVALAALATLILAGCAAATSLSWMWPLLPFAVGAATLVFSRACAIRSQRIGEEEVAQLHRLRDQLSRSSASGKVSTEVTTVEAEAVQSPVSDASGEGVEDESLRADQVTNESEELAEDLQNEAQAVAEETVASAIEEEIPAPVERRTWTPAAIPAPTYAMRARLSGRIVHPDTDIRGIPRVDARIPARPIAAGPVPKDARSTEEVVAYEAVVLDVEAALDSRIAQ
ncbi:hypothetical protein HMPREF9061_00730 [Actinomyces sp. oral taxon 181 str. F0379]|nr:hypothetical protein HMPREF9061_00730 [Actinomyces sp. oral taxon 181 str. F0379]